MHYESKRGTALDDKDYSNSDSNGASQPPPRTHDSIPPRLDLITRTGRPLRH